MELSNSITHSVQAVQGVVLHPTFASGMILLGTSFVNELFAVLPYSVILLGQLFFLKGPMSFTLIMKLIVFVAIPVSVGTTVGSFATYVLSYYGGKPIIKKYGKYVHLSWESVEKVQNKFAGFWYDEIVFLALRCIPFFPSLPINVVAGTMRMKPAPYTVLTLAGTLIKMLLMFALVAVGVIGLAL